MHPYLEEPNRRHYYCPAVDKVKEDGYGNVTTPVPGTHPKANLIASKCYDDLHAPVIDFDIPIEVLPSSQLGHHHLYINKKLSWPDYKKLLKVLGEIGLVEPGYVDSSLKAGFSAVRPPGKTKPGVKGPVDILVENAKLRKENYQLRKQVNENNTQGSDG